MKYFVPLISCLCLFATACNKTPTVNPVSGTINGTPTITVYGSSNKPSDYVLISTDSSKNIMAYGSQVLPFQISNPDTIIFITLPSTKIARATLIRTKTSAILKIATSAPAYFISDTYKSQ